MASFTINDTTYHSFHQESEVTFKIGADNYLVRGLEGDSFTFSPPIVGAPFFIEDRGEMLPARHGPNKNGTMKMRCKHGFFVANENLLNLLRPTTIASELYPEFEVQIKNFRYKGASGASDLSYFQCTGAVCTGNSYSGSKGEAVDMHDLDIEFRGGGLMVAVLA